MELLHSLLNVLYSVADLLVALGRAALPWTPLFAWVAFWTLAVDWTKLYPILMRGGIVGVGLLFFVAVLVWSVIAPPPDNVHHLFGLAVGNVTGKFVYVTALTVIMFLCASVQLSGCCGSLLNLEQPVALVELHDDHGHGAGPAGHGHGDHHAH